MGLFYTPHISTWSTQRKSIFFLIALTLCLAFLAIASPQVSAADASWTSPSRESITYEGKVFNGPHKNDSTAQGTIGWSPDSEFKQSDVIFYKYTTPQQAMSGGEIIWFPKGASVDGAASANYSVLEKSKNGSFDTIKSGSTVQVKLTLSANPVEAATNAVKSVFRSSIASYVNGQCNGRFTNAGQRTECVNSVNTQFNDCWSRQVGTVSFVTSIDPQKPADGINLENLAFCIASNSGVGKSGEYETLLESKLADANNAGVDAFNAATPEGVEAQIPSSCQIDGIGWIVCPMTTMLAGLTDNVYKVISELLEVKVFSNTTSNDALRTGWSTMLGFANVAFVIAFLIIIYSQLTGGGFTNYAIKRMLPRLVIAAILVNLSFWICALAVDISNILGYSLQNIFNSLGEGLPKNNQIPTWEQVTINLLSAGAIVTAGIVVVAVGATGAMLGLLGVLWPLLIAAIFAVLVTLVILTARQAIVIILIIISPLAFVAFLLPNTEKWFNRWRDLFATMLFLFPIMSLVFGGSQYAAQLVMTTSPSGAVVIMAIAIQVIPLALTPLILKFSGGLLSKIGGMVNNPNKGPLDRLKNAGSKRIERRQDIDRNLQRDANIASANKILKGKGGRMGGQYSKKRRLAAYIASRGATGNINLDQKQGFAKGSAEESAQQYFAERALNDVATFDKEGKAMNKGFAEHIAGAEKAEGLMASAQGAVDKIIQQDVANRIILYKADVKIRNNPEDELTKALQGGDEIGVRALGAMHMENGSGGYDKFRDTARDFLNDSSVDADTHSASSSHLKKFISDNGRDFVAKDPAMMKFAKSDNTIDDVLTSPTSVKRNDEQLAGITDGAMRNAVASGSITSDKAAAVLRNPQVAKLASDSNQLALRAVIASGGKVTPNAGESMEAAISRIGNTAPTVEEIQAAAIAQPQQPQQQGQGQQQSQQPQPISTQGSAIPHGTVPATPANSRTTQPSTIGYSQTDSGLVLPDSAIKEIKKAAAQAPTAVNNVVNNQTLNQTNNDWSQTSQPFSVPAGRRSSGAPLDNPSASIRSPGGPQHATPETPQDHPANIPKEFFE